MGRAEAKWRGKSQESAIFRLKTTLKPWSGAGHAACTGTYRMSVSPGRVHLDDLLTVCRAGDHVNRELLKEMLALFIEDNRRRVDLAIEAAASGDPIGLRSAVHAIKGSAALIGAAHLRDLAGKIEMRVVSGTIRNDGADIATLRNEFDAVVATLRSLYPDLPAA